MHLYHSCYGYYRCCFRSCDLATSIANDSGPSARPNKLDPSDRWNGGPPESPREATRGDSVGVNSRGRRHRRYTRHDRHPRRRPHVVIVSFIVVVIVLDANPICVLCTATADPLHVLCRSFADPTQIVRTACAKATQVIRKPNASPMQRLSAHGLCRACIFCECVPAHGHALHRSRCKSCLHSTHIRCKSSACPMQILRRSYANQTQSLCKSCARRTQILCRSYARAFCAYVTLRPSILRMCIGTTPCSLRMHTCADTHGRGGMGEALSDP